MFEQETLKERVRKSIKGGSIQDISDTLEELNGYAQDKYPGITTYSFIKFLAGVVPGCISSELQTAVLDAARSKDENINRVGKKALLLLNSKTLLSVVDRYSKNDEENRELQDELMEEAIVSLDILFDPKTKNTTAVPQQVHEAARRAAISQYFAARDSVSAKLTAHTSYPLVAKIADALVNDATRPSRAELEVIADELSKDFGIPYETLLAYLIYKLTPIAPLKEGSVESSDGEIAFCNQELHGDLVAILLSVGLTKKQIEVMNSLMSGKTIKEIALERGVSLQNIYELANAAYAKIRKRGKTGVLEAHLYATEPPRVLSAPHTVRANGVIFSRDAAVVKPPKARRFIKEFLEGYPIGKYVASKKIRDMFEKEGIRQLGDFFSIPPEELLVDKDLIFIDTALEILHAQLEPTYWIAKSNSDLRSKYWKLNHVVEAVLYQRGQLPSQNGSRAVDINSLTDAQKGKIFREAYEKLDNALLFARQKIKRKVVGTG